MASKLAHRSLLVWSTLAAAAGCGQLLGINDYEIDPSLDRPNAAGGDGQGGSGGGTKPGTAGKSAGGAAGESGALGGSAGEPGVPSGAGAGMADAGAGGEGTAPTGKFQGCDGTPFAGSEAIVRSCILRVGCQVWNYPKDTISRCVSQNTQNTYEGTKCTLDAQTCDDITACEGTHLEDTFCIGKEDGQYCNGNEVVTCGAYSYARDCDKDGGTCYDFGVEIDDFGHTVSCALDDVACTGTDPAETCGGPGSAYKYQCSDGVAYGTKCSNFAASCQGDPGAAGCFYPVNGCSSEGVSCSNGRATWCDGESKAIFDCGSVGLGCQTEGDYYADQGRQCAAPGCGLNDLVDCKESCSEDGKQLTFCYGGAPVTVDCKDYGFTQCAEYDYDCAGSQMTDCLYTDDVIHFADCE